MVLIPRAVIVKFRQLGREWRGHIAHAVRPHAFGRKGPFADRFLFPIKTGHHNAILKIHVRRFVDQNIGGQLRGIRGLYKMTALACSRRLGKRLFKKDLLRGVDRRHRKNKPVPGPVIERITNTFERHKRLAGNLLGPTHQGHLTLGP